MSTTLIGRFYPQEKRSGVISWTVAGMSVSYIIATLSIAYLSSIGEWRLAFEAYVLPLYIVGFAMVFFFIPNPGSGKIKINLDTITRGFRDILYNKSAVSCLVGYALSMAAWQFNLLYAMSFLRTRFGVSTAIVSLFMIATALSFTVGSLAGGRLVNRLGRKRTTVLTTLIVGLLTLASPNIPLFELYVRARDLANNNASSLISISWI